MFYTNKTQFFFSFNRIIFSNDDDDETKRTRACLIKTQLDININQAEDTDTYIGVVDVHWFFWRGRDGWWLKWI